MNPSTPPQLLGIDFHFTAPGKKIKWRLYALPVSPQAPWRSYLIQHGLISGEQSFHQAPRAWAWQPAEQRSPLCFHSAPIFCVLFVAMSLGMAAQPLLPRMDSSPATPASAHFTLVTG